MIWRWKKVQVWGRVKGAAAYAKLLSWCWGREEQQHEDMNFMYFFKLFSCLLMHEDEIQIPQTLKERPPWFTWYEFSSFDAQMRIVEICIWQCLRDDASTLYGRLSSFHTDCNYKISHFLFLSALILLLYENLGAVTFTTTSHYEKGEKQKKSQLFFFLITQWEREVYVMMKMPVLIKSS